MSVDPRIARIEQGIHNCSGTPTTSPTAGMPSAARCRTVTGATTRSRGLTPRPVSPVADPCSGSECNGTWPGPEPRRAFHVRDCPNDPRRMGRGMSGTATHGPDDECAACYECPGCGGGDGSTPRRSHLRVRPGVVHLVCSDCDGDGVLCPNCRPDAIAEAGESRG